jgi:hypothetical protein
MRQRTQNLILSASLAVVAGLFTAPALADAIDGDWCNAGSSFTIEGDSIVTPARNKVPGRYTRYSFAYVVPEGEPGAGSEVSMVMIRGMETVQLTRAGQSSAPEAWRRCKPIS